MTEDNAIEVANVSKSFRIYHERTSTLYDHLTGILDKKRHYEELKVLDNISFNVKKGEMIGIIGRNGEGKTTLLRLLTRIFKPDSGTIKINGSIVPFLELGSGFQPELTAVDNIVTYGILLGFTKKQIREKIPSILEYAELEKFADTKLKHFSSGMYTRLAFSTAVQVDPDILLVDEVLSVGDVPFQEKSFHTFLSFKKRGKTIVFVSHSLQQVTRLCDRAIFLDQGKIHSIGKPSEVVNDFYKIVEGKKPTIDETVNTASIIRRSEPTGISINKSKNILYVTNLASDQLVVIDGKTNQIIKYLNVGIAPREVVVDAKNDLIYVANRDSNSVSVIEGVSNEIVSSITVGEKPRGIAINALTNRIYVANRDSNSISVIDGFTKSVIVDIPVLSGPSGLAISEKDNKIYVTNSFSNYVSVIDGNTNKVISNILVGNTPIGIAINALTNRIYVANRDSNSISIIDSEHDGIIKNISIGKGPFGISLIESENIIFVTNSGSNTLLKIDGKNEKIIASMEVGNMPLGIDVNPNTNKIYVANQTDDKVTVVDGIKNMVSDEIKIVRKLSI